MSLADPSSPTHKLLVGLLTISIALFGVGVLLRSSVSGRDIITEFAKIGFVLTLATSWAAWRVLGYNLIIYGPAELSQVIGNSARLPGVNGDLISGLQRIDNGLASLILYGSGRLGVAQGDWFQLGFARDAFLSGTLVSLGLIRFLAGILLALAPFISLLLLFRSSTPVFVGWARGLALCFLGSVIITLILSAEIALLDPWLQTVIAERAADQPTLNAPAELLVLTLSFALIAVGALALIARIAFHPAGHSVFFDIPQRSAPRAVGSHIELPATTIGRPDGLDIAAVGIAEHFRREDRSTRLFSRQPDSRISETLNLADGEKPQGGRDALGSSYRRTGRRISRVASARDRIQ